MKTAAQLRKEADALYSQATRLNDEAVRLEQKESAERRAALDKRIPNFDGSYPVDWRAGP